MVNDAGSSLQADVAENERSDIVGDSMVPDDLNDSPIPSPTQPG